jgi:hypothetical protein
MSIPAPAPSAPRTARPPRRVAPFAVLGAVVLGGAAVVVAHRAGIALPACPFHELTGLDCPGCGGTRAVLALGRGDVAAAADHHVLLVLALIPLLLVGWAAWVRAAWQGRHVRLVLPPRAVPALVAVLVAFTVLRNVPGVPLLDAA